MKLHPLKDRVVAKPVEAAAKTSSGFYVPDSAKEKPQIGEVVAVGSDVKEVKVGDKIVYEQYKKDDFKLDGEELFIVKEENILAVVKA